ncbi:hypothetical protein [Actinorugispora endophytica]|uniref:Uncharacterized protein n=1 Tax=Actinorugispora endophytica TaxID=1605990 RepID=A0A4R6V125_9ACTN|nr:hypothetical protein [Actinorugispora endophytica]TDQ53735.1 hypothetical protein EV190_103186 [Actinorugispora endophytica]
MPLSQLASILLTAVGAAMLAAGPVMVVRGVLGRREIRAELAEQRITFPEKEGLPAGRPVTTGIQAKAFADVIKGNLAKATGGRAYSEISAEITAGNRDEALARLRQTAFTGETLRASLMSAYQAWLLTTLVTALGALLAALGAALVVLGQAL